MKEVINPEELNLSERLAVARTILGADRTLLAWVRTSLSLISFGFTIYAVLNRFQSSGVVKLVRTQTPRNIGIFMILVGIVPLALSMVQYRRGVKRLGGKNVYVNAGMVAAGGIVLLGVFLLVVVVMNLDVL